VPKLLSARQVLRALGRAGFEVVSQRGSHIKLKKPVEGGELVVILPSHQELAEGTLAVYFARPDCREKSWSVCSKIGLK